MLNNFYNEYTKIFKENDGWTNINDIKSGDRILNVDLDDDRKAFFAPVLVTEKREIKGSFNVGPLSFSAGCQVLIRKDGQPCLTTWRELYNQFGDDRDKWTSLHMYTSCNYAPERPVELGIVELFTMGILLSYPNNCTPFPLEDEGAALKIEAPRNSILASNLFTLLNDKKIAYSEDRMMSKSVVTIYDDSIKKFLETYLVKCQNMIPLFNGKIIDFYPYHKNQIIDMFINRDNSTFDMSIYSTSLQESLSLRTTQRGWWCRQTNTPFTMFSYEAFAIISEVLATLATTADESAFSWRSKNTDTVGLLFDKMDSTCMWSDDVSVDLEEEYPAKVYAIKTQTPYVLTQPQDAGWGALSVIAPVG